MLKTTCYACDWSGQKVVSDCTQISRAFVFHKIRESFITHTRSNRYIETVHPYLDIARENICSVDKKFIEFSFVCEKCFRFPQWIHLKKFDLPSCENFPGSCLFFFSQEIKFFRSGIQNNCKHQRSIQEALNLISFL